MAKFSNLFGQDALWDSPQVAMNPIYTIFGSASTANRAEARTALLNFATRSPTVIAMTLDGNDDRIYIAHTPTVHPARAGTVSAHDNLVVTLINDDANSLIDITLPSDAFERTAEVVCVRRDATAAGFAATPVAQHFGPHAGTIISTRRET